jgi:hypothetical protein
MNIDGHYLAACRTLRDGEADPGDAGVTSEVKIRAPANQLTPWTESLPSGWRLIRMDNVAHVVFSNVDKHTLEDEEVVRLCNYVDVYKNDRITRAIKFMEASAQCH